MIVRGYHLYRQRRSSRIICYVLFILTVFYLWKTGNLAWGRRMEPKQTLAARTSPEIVDDAFDEEVSSDSHYPRHRLNSINDLADLYPNSFPSSSPEPHVHSQGQSTHNVEHAVKSAKSDEDDAMFNRKLSSFDSDRQIRIDNTGTKATLKQHPHRSLLPKKASEDITEEETYLVESLDTPQGDTSHPLETTKKHKPLDRGYTFPSWSECEETKDKADVLPDMIHVPFEQSVRDVILEGWEDEWIATASYTGPRLDEPKIDFVYNWVNGSQPEMVETMHPYELNSTLNDEEGEWISSHGSNRYREWDELRYSVRSVEKYAGRFTNRIQILMNAFRTVSEEESAPHTYGKQHPNWLKGGLDKVQVLSQEEFFGPDEMKCLPTFDSLTIENQLYNTKSEVDRLFALSDDMILGKPHSASDIYSPLFGPTLGFKDNAYNTLQPPTEKDADRFGEKPFLIYTSWLLNRRFGARKRKGQVHFGHSLSRSITKEAITSFPRPALRSAIQRFRGETGFQLYSWYVIFHYTMERHREALLWSYIMLRSDTDDDGYLSWNERKRILRELNEGMANEAPEQFRHRMYYRVGDYLAKAGLQPPIVNTDILWTSLDGPAMIKDLDCDAFDTEDCLAPGFSIPASDAEARSPVFSSAAIFDRVARESPRCGDCLLKLILNRRSAGLGPLLPHPVKKPEQRAIVVKAVMKYQYTIVNPDAMFYMVTDAEQAEHALLKPYIKHNKKVGQMCLNDDVATADVEELEKLRKVMKALFEGLLPEPSSFEK